MTLLNIVLVIAAIAMAVLFFLQKQKTAVLKNENAGRQLTIEGLERQIAGNQAKITALEAEISGLRRELTDRQVENARLAEKIQNLDLFNATIQKEAETKFKVLAGEIFAHQSKDSERRLGELLQPLRENIADFKKTVTDAYISEAKERSALGQHIQGLMELNRSIGKEARELTEALTGNTKVQGDWGEMVLQTILEKSGLVENENFFVQNTRHEDGSVYVGENNRRLRPDVVVILPDKKFVVIDSKVSLTAYVDYVNADTEEKRESSGRRHLQSIRAHLKELETKKYQDYVGPSNESRLDYVLMFIPNEHAYMTAMSLDNQLWMEAYEKRVVIISPVHVMSTLRLIAQLWTRDRQTKNALKIAEEGGRLYDKFVGFVSDMDAIGQGMDKARDAYDKAMNKLKSGNGNLISKTARLRELGAKTEKMLPETE